ncbi:hypothetical protein CEXT_213761 [Caerostris extrusa]|uniref:Uncharacterized protein n=1 Tax=Caerostris extrusa TaxID=172846 RepID=A0AAV4Y6Q6_CAEEX|nr:hypothetical protein CEXT_213761 [Caerostris extrusa]
MSIQDAEIHAWTDSKIVLLWLSSHPKRWKTFIANRAAKILECLSSSSWHCVPSKEIPTGIAARGINPQNLGSSSMGQTFHQDFNYWPFEDPESEQVPKELLDPIFSNSCTINYILQNIFEKYSSLAKIILILAIRPM